MKKKIGIVICLVLIVLTVGFIWNNSRQPVEVSNESSKAVADKLNQVVEKNENLGDSILSNVVITKVRKAAHAIEFFVLGVELSVLSFILKRKFNPQSLWNILSTALAIAVADESIQIISARGSAVKDVLIDFCGALIGFLLALLVKFIIDSCKNKGRKRYGKN